LRARTYALGSPLEVKRFFIPSIKPKLKPEPVIEAISTSLLLSEIEKVREQYTLFENKNYLVICTPSSRIPHLMLEIGRLREITFRAIGEGTNRSYDLDEYDLYYNQLVIWDTEKQKLVGAYRIGKGKEIYEQYGISGFYLHSLFRMKKPFHSILKESLELGRSFIVEEYQRKPMSLFLLWKGILYFQIRNPEYRYMIGPVSISNEFSKFSKNLIVEYLKHYYYNPELAKYIYPRKEYIVEGDYKVDKAIFLENASMDVSRIDVIIKDVEQKYSMPVLLKKYLSLGAQLVGFNIDPKFNDALDGLILVDIYTIPVNVVESLSKELNDENLLSRFTNGKEK
jgi:putative hemolysin